MCRLRLEPTADFYLAEFGTPIGSEVFPRPTALTRIGGHLSMARRDRDCTVPFLFHRRRATGRRRAFVVTLAVPQPSGSRRPQPLRARLPLHKDQTRLARRSSTRNRPVSRR